MTESSATRIEGKLDTLALAFRDHKVENEVAHAGMASDLERHGVEKERVGEELVRYREALFGNGEVGIAERLRTLERFASVMARLMWILVPAFLLGTAAIVWEAVRAYLAAAPV